MRGLGRITGGGFLEAMAEFITELNDLFGGFKHARRRWCEQALRSPEVAFVLVTSPAPMSIQEVLYFSERLVESHMPRGAFVVNRVRQPPMPLDGAADLDIGAASAVRRHRDGRRRPGAPPQAHARRRSIWRPSTSATSRISSVRAGVEMPIVRVPELPTDVYDAQLLSELAAVLTG